MPGLSNEQAQELMDAIVEKCETMDLMPDEILDGLGRVLISAADAFGKTSAVISIDNFGTCEVSISKE